MGLPNKSSRSLRGAAKKAIDVSGQQVATVIDGKPVPVFTVEQQTRGLAWVREIGVFSAFGAFAVPFFPLLFWMAPWPSGFPRYFWALGIGTGMLIATVLGGLLAVLCWRGLPRLYFHLFPKVRQVMQIDASPEGLCLGDLGCWPWDALILDYPWRGNASGLLISRRNAVPLLVIEPESCHEQFEEMVRYLQSHLPPVQLPTVSGVGIVDHVAIARQAAAFFSVALARRGGGDLLYEQLPQTILQHISHSSCILLHYSQKYPEGHGVPFSLPANDMDKPVIGWERVKWINLETRILHLRLTESLRGGSSRSEEIEMPLEDLVLLCHSCHWEDCVTYDLGLCIRTKVRGMKRYDEPSCICLMHTSFRESWTLELGSTIAARWGIELLRIENGTVRHCRDLLVCGQ